MFYIYGLLLLLKVSLREVNSECQTEIRSYSRGEIVSEPSEYQYPNNYCKFWLISGKQNSTVTISFDYLDIETDDNATCNQDFLEVGPVRGRRYCGSSVPPPYIATVRQDHVWLRFVTDGLGQGRGFKLTYIVDYVPSRIGCLENESMCANQKCIFDKWRCNSFDECGDNSDETSCGPDVKRPTMPPRDECESPNFKCVSADQGRLFCFHPSAMCDGHQDCDNGLDESPASCNKEPESCHKHLDGPMGHFTTPRFPNDYPNNVDCDWRLHLSSPNKKLQLRFVDWVLQDEPNTDYVIVYDGKNENSDIVGKYNGQHHPPALIESTGNWLFVTFHSDDKYPEKGFNASFQEKVNFECSKTSDCGDNSKEEYFSFQPVLHDWCNKGCGYCLPNQWNCGFGDVDCYDVKQRCDGYWDCKHFGGDERGCDKCSEDSYSCGRRTAQCYKMRDRCNGNHTCISYADETNCTIEKCSPDVGLFLCKNKKCIYEWWMCDRTNDCGDNSDEENCSFSTPRVIIAAVVGSMVCSLLLVVALGCTCKVYALRMQDQNVGRHETPLCRMHAELVRRRAPPPPYNEAMRTSAPYNEVQSFFQRLQAENAAAGRTRPLPQIPESAPLNQASDDPANANFISVDDDVPLISVASSNDDENDDRSSTSVVEMIPPTTASDSEGENEREGANQGCDNFAFETSVDMEVSESPPDSSVWKNGESETSVIEPSVENYNDDGCSDSADSASASISLDNVSIPTSESSPYKKNTSSADVSSPREIIDSRERSRHNSQNSLESNVSEDSGQQLI